MTQPDAVYLDNAATTRPLPEVVDAMLPFLREAFGNPSSLHRLGAAAARGLDEARREVAELLGARPGDVVLTSGGTEANNLAIRGAVAARRRRGDHVVTTAVEHPSVLEVCRGLEEEGLRVTYVGVDGEGRLDPEAVAAAVDERTILVSVMHVQNETGAVFPVEAIARAVKARSRRLVVHSDGVQAAGKLPTPAGVDLYTVSAHKLHGPKGAGALLARTRVAPLLRGGGQERGLRCGTEAVPALVGFGAAARAALAERARAGAALSRLGAVLRAGLEARGAAVSSPPDGAPWIVNASFPGAAAEPLLHALEGRRVFVSTGSACASRQRKRSPVLQAMGLPRERVDSAVRFSLSRLTTPDEVQRALAALDEALASLGLAPAGAGREAADA